MADTNTIQTPEIQDALRNVLRESGAAGTGPLNLPPPADITSEQARSTSTEDPYDYSNNLTAQLYRDADGKIWTQPGPGHDEPNLSIRIRKGNGQWHVVAAMRKRTRRVKRKGRVVYEEFEQGPMGISGAPVTELGSPDRAEQFSPRDVKTAIRQTIAELQKKGAIWAPNEPESPVNVSNGLFAGAALAALAAAAALAGLGPFAAPANAVGGAAPVATVAPTVAVVQTFVLPTVPVGSGTISFALPPRYGTNPTITSYGCRNATLAPDSTPGVPPPSGLGPDEPAIGIQGIVYGGFQGGRTAVPTQTFFAFFTATRTFIGFQDSQFMPPLRGGPLGLFEKDKHVAGTATVSGSGAAGQSSAQLSGTVTADITCTSGPTAAPAVAPVAPVAQVKITDAPSSPSGNSPWPLGLAVLAIAAAAGGLATRSRGASATTAGSGRQQSDPRTWRHVNRTMLEDIDPEPVPEQWRPPADPGFDPKPPPDHTGEDDERVPLG